jgi:hypothetical protein
LPGSVLLLHSSRAARWVDVSLVFIVSTPFSAFRPRLSASNSPA